MIALLYRLYRCLSLLVVVTAVLACAFSFSAFAGNRHKGEHGKEVVKSLADMFVEAEAQPDPEERIKLWGLLLGRMSDTDTDSSSESRRPGRDVSSDKVITKKAIRYNIVHDYMLLYKKEQDMDHLKKAVVFINDFNDDEQKLWSFVHLLDTVSTADTIKLPGVMELAADTVDSAEMYALGIKDTQKRGRVFYTLAEILSRTDKNGSPIFEGETLALAHGFVKQIDDSRLRIRAAESFSAVMSAIPAGELEEGYRQVYSILAKEKEKDKAALKAEEKTLMQINSDAMSKGRFELALFSLMMLENDDRRPEILFKFFERNFKEGEISRAVRVARAIDKASKALNAWSMLGSHYLIRGYNTQSEYAFSLAESYIGGIESEKSRERAGEMIANRKESARKEFERLKEKHDKGKDVRYPKPDRKIALKAVRLAKKHELQKAVEITKEMSHPIYRAETFREIAEIQASFNDKYNILEDVNNDSLEYYSLSSGDGKTQVKEPRLSVQEVHSYEKEIEAKLNDDPESILVKRGLPSDIAKLIHKDSLPKRLSYNGDTIRENLPPVTGAEIEVSYYENNLFNQKMYGVYGNAGFVKHQKVSAPDIIVIENGVADIPAIYDYLTDNGKDGYIIKEGKTYLLRRPIVISNNATLVISGDDVDALRLSTEYGAYIINVGEIYIADTKFIGWSEANNEPMWATYKEKRKFRPFLTSWSRSKTYIGSSEIISVGYANGKSYGLSLSSGPQEWLKLGNDANINRPTGIMTDNSIRNTLYGFYSYEADDVVLTGNEYVDNIVYGVDPHDRSRRLAIGYNTAYGTHKKHGIIISREVNDSLIMGNLTFENHGTGIMLDRDSNGTLVYGNTTFNNHQEGMTLFESDCEIIASNQVFGNKGAGFRIRNSYNIGLFYNDIYNNRAAAISGYEATLKGDPVHAHRDFELDPYDELTAISVVGNLIRENNRGISIEGIDALYLKDNKFVKQSPKILQGKWFEQNPDILFRYGEEYGVSINSRCPRTREPLKVQECKFRKNKTLWGDGQNYLIDRIAKSSCAKPVIRDAKEGAHE